MNSQNRGEVTLKQFTARVLGSFVLICALLALTSLFTENRVRNNSANVRQAFHRVRLSEELQVHLLSTNREWLMYGLTNDEKHEVNRIEQEREVLRTLADLEAIARTDRGEKALVAVTQTAHTYLDKRREAASIGLPLSESYLKVNRYLRSAHQQAAKLARQNLIRASNAVDRTQAGARFVALMAIVVLLFATILLPISSFSIRKMVYRPILHLRSGIQSFKRTGQSNHIAPEGVLEIKEVAEAFNDLTDRLASQRKDQFRFLAGVAHDLKNPLSAIKMSTDLLSAEELPTDTKNEMLQIISRQADQLIRMVGDFLDASRVESGQLELIKSPTQLNSIVHDSVLLHSQTSSRHRISMSSSSENIDCNCDATRITQVINNILNNAIKYSPNGGEVKVHLTTEDDFAVIRISDEGIGLTEDEKTKIFEPFRRTQLTKETIPGVGLGLSVSKHIIEGHGGSIEIESRPQTGTTFALKLPMGHLAKRKSTRPMQNLTPPEMNA